MPFRYQIHHRLWFGRNSFFWCSFLLFFSTSLARRLKIWTCWCWTNREDDTVELPFVRLSASWFVVALVYFVTARESLSTDQRMSSLLILAKYKHVMTILEQIFQQSPRRFQLLLCEQMVVQRWCGDLIQLLDCPVCQCALSFHSFLRMCFHVIRSSDSVRVRFLPAKWLFNCSNRDWWFEHFLSSSIICSFHLHSLWMHPKDTWSRKKRCRFSQVNEFDQFLSHGLRLGFLPTIFCHSRSPIGIVLTFHARRSIPKSVLSPIPVPTALFFNLSFPQWWCKLVTIQLSLKKNNWFCNVAPRFWPLVS